MEEIWLQMYYKAKSLINSKDITPFISSGSNACVILSSTGKMYEGINIVSSSSINSCAEKNAVANMLSQGESCIKKIVIINELEEVIKPCKKCLTYLLELNNENEELEILTDVAPIKITKLYKQLPNWWGTLRIKR